MKLKSMAVLLSSYNGERYIGEQLDSIIKCYRDFDLHIHIRDDGSVDSTCEIIKEYISKNDSIFLYEGDNVGVIASFLWLVENVGDYDYYAFCDQDDVWEPLKLIAATTKIIKYNQDIAIGYCSSYNYVDKELNHIGRYNSQSNFSLNNILIENCAPGCTFVFNQSLRKLYLDINEANMANRIVMHDWFFLILARTFGHLIYDHNSYLSYRQHDNNVVGIKSGFKNILCNRLKQFKKYKQNGRHLLSLQMDLVSLYCLKHNKEAAYEISHGFVESQASLVKRLRYVFSGYVKRVRFIDDVLFKVLFIIGWFK
ncbi:glycosyltransferase [Escherichia coli]